MPTHSPDPLGDPTRVMPAHQPAAAAEPSPDGAGGPVAAGSQDTGPGRGSYDEPSGAHAQSPVPDGSPPAPPFGPPHGYHAVSYGQQFPEEPAPYGQPAPGRYAGGQYEYPDAPVGTPYSSEPSPENHTRTLSDSGGPGKALVAAGLAFLVVVLGAPALVLAWRNAVGVNPFPAGVVGGLLAVTGLAVLAVGLFPLLTRGSTPPDGQDSGEAKEGRSARATLLEPPVLLVVVGAVVLLGAALAANVDVRV